MSQSMILAQQATSDSQVIDLWLFGKSNNTASAYRLDAGRFTAFVAKPLSQVTLGDLQAYAVHLAEQGLSAGSQRRMLASAKSLLTFAQRIGYTPYNVGAALVIRRLPSGLAQRILSESDIHRMLALEPEPRNRALLRLLYASGARVSELCALTWRDVVHRDNGIQVRLVGKGDKERVILLRRDLAADLDELRAAGAGSEGVVNLSRAQVWRVVSSAARRAGLAGAVSPHWLRHACASHSLDRGAPIHLVQSQLGHASLDTTTGYTHARPDDGLSRYLAL